MDIILYENYMKAKKLYYDTETIQAYQFMMISLEAFTNHLIYYK